jgi:hypothetical protein
VKSQPPPAPAGAIHSVFPGSKAFAVVLRLVTAIAARVSVSFIAVLIFIVYLSSVIKVFKTRFYK